VPVIVHYFNHVWLANEEGRLMMNILMYLDFVSWPFLRTVISLLYFGISDRDKRFSQNTSPFGNQKRYSRSLTDTTEQHVHVLEGDNNGHFGQYWTFWLVLIYRRNTVGGQFIGPAQSWCGRRHNPYYCAVQTVPSCWLFIWVLLRFGNRTLPQCFGKPWVREFSWWI